MCPAPPPATPGPATAVVIGSGLAGLCTAQVLSKHYDAVIVLERDAAPATSCGLSAVDAANQRARPGVFQYHFLHALMAKGLYVLNDIFEGRFQQAFVAAGANLADNMTATCFLHPSTGLLPWARPAAGSGCGASGASSTADGGSFPVCFATRHTIETTARRLLETNARVTIRYSSSVKGLTFAARAGSDAAAAASDAAAGGMPSRVTGVALADGSCVPAQLVVDCSGRGSALPGWLAAAGVPRPRTTRAGCNGGYCCWLCKLDPQVEAALLASNVQGINLLQSPDAPTSFILIRIESGQWLAGLGGSNGVHPAGQEDAQLLAFAQEKLWHPLPARVLAGATRLAPVQHYYNVTSTWRHYENVPLPAGLLVMADAVCSFNPTYGQGITVAALEAAALDKLLQRQRQQQQGKGAQGGNLHQQLQAAMLPTIQAAWDMAVGADMAYACASSNDPALAKTGPLARAMQGYMQCVFAACGRDLQVRATFTRVVNMLAGPESLMAPRIVARVLLPRLAAAVGAVLQAWLPHWAGTALGVLGHSKGEQAAPPPAQQWSPEFLDLLGVTAGARVHDSM